MKCESIEMLIEVKTTDLNKVDAMMKKMLRALSVEELDLLKTTKVTKTIAEVEMSTEDYNNNEQQN